MVETEVDPRRQPLRIVHTESSCGWGGQELRILTEAAGMIARGHEVRLLCPPAAPIGEAARARGIPVDPLPIDRRQLRGLRAARAWLRAHSVDVLNTHSSTDSWLFSIAARIRRRRVPVVRTRHVGSPIARDPATRWLYVHGAHQVVACGGNMRRAMIEDNRFPSRQIVSVPTGIDTDRFVPGDRDAARARLRLPADRLLVGIVAVLRKSKGHQHLAQALQRLGRDDVELIVVGDGVSRQAIEDQIASAGMMDRTRMVGQQDDVVPWLQALDIFALPSWAVEGVPQGIMQAMSCGLPVVATSVGSIADAVVDGLTGSLVAPEDPPALSRALDRLLRDHRLRQRYGEHGRKRAVSQLGIDRMLDRMESVFRQAANRAA